MNDSNSDIIMQIKIATLSKGMVHCDRILSPEID